MNQYKTREVKVGSVGVGGDNPIRMQSMTTSDTKDVEATVDQIIRLADHGCEIVRVTVQGIKEADACEAIKNSLIQKGYSIPLVADIHFYPKAAMRVVEFVDKVRINPGNFVDKRATFRVLEYDDATYAAELEKIKEKFLPFVEKCQQLKKAIRIGVNHGSLSDRIMNRYGDTPAGMVESALEYTRICRKIGYHEIIFSMKASDPRVMIEAYRLLAKKMIALGWNYPIHLGVTEAGEGEDGRVKSAVGIGTLLLEGIGDTIRTSLTEDPWHEIDPCKRLIRFADNYQTQRVRGANSATTPSRYDLYSLSEVEGNLYQTHRFSAPSFIHRDGSVILQATAEEACEIDGVDALVVPGGCSHKKIPILDAPFVLSDSVKEWEKLLENRPEVLFFAPRKNRVLAARALFNWLEAHRIFLPVILQFSYDCSPEDLVIQAAAEFGSLLCDRLGQGICIDGNYPWQMRKTLSFAILQAAGMRRTKTEFISCPGCGRTLFDLQSTSARIRERTGHLPGVKIAIMGCIVNGPGEMADADFGYVGSQTGKVDLYVGRECVEKNIDSAVADDRLIDLIKSHGRWVEPPQSKAENSTECLV
ncbi:MAG: 4-hydroxy-3-methylbut-2-en-1-yl diphosphate synthase (ferredoxin) [Chlamydiae bacterium]|nr:4-hydroxy-3-methylbut-2-en-1-yl diphosphate synthase (ferredoxin) [Chlamydiota bacterium]